MASLPGRSPAPSRLWLGVLLCGLLLASSEARARVRRETQAGVRHCQAVIETLRGKRGCVVFDIDNTLVDARGRTRAAWRAYCATDSGAPRRVPLRCIGWDGTETARRLGVDEQRSAAFASHWDRFFWTPANVHHDTGIRQTIRLARLAAAAGLEVYYLTGRVRGMKQETIAQLAAHELPFADQRHVICKPSLDVRTVDFKRDVLARLGAQRPIGWYMTDSRREVAELQRDPAVPCVLVDFPVQAPSRDAIARHTPRIEVRDRVRRR